MALVGHQSFFCLHSQPSPDESFDQMENHIVT